MSTLRVFEAAGRHLSFKNAAEELRLTPSAVSHAIQSLEAWLGFPLFLRGSRGLALTEPGAAYLAAVREALLLLAKATEGLPVKALGKAVSVSAAPTFGARWLLPHLPDFAARHPDIRVSIDTAHRQIVFPHDGIDLAIRLGHEPPARLYSLRLLGEHLVPVCAPDFRERFPGLRAPADLAEVPIIKVTTVSEEWDAWCRRAGHAPIMPKQVLSFDTVQLAFDAASQGFGVALGRRPLVDREIESGRLVPLFPPAVESGTAYWLVGAREAIARPAVAAFRTWLAASLKTEGLR